MINKHLIRHVPLLVFLDSKVYCALINAIRTQTYIRDIYHFLCILNGHRYISIISEKNASIVHLEKGSSWIKNDITLYLYMYRFNAEHEKYYIAF